MPGREAAPGRVARLGHAPARFRAALTRRLDGAGFWRALATAFGLGAFAALALPPVHAVPVLLVALPGLFIMTMEAPSARRAALVAFAWGWGFHVAGLHWLTNAILTEVERYWWLVPLAVPGLAIPLAAFTVIPALMARWAAPGWPRILAFAAAWVAAEMLRGVLFTGFPWNLIGTVWAFGALPIQSAAWIGVHGLGLVTLLVVLAPMMGGRAAAGGLAVIAAFAAFGMARLLPQEPDPEPVALVLVQGNVAQEAKWREESRIPIFQRYIDLTAAGVQAARRDAPDSRILVIWPETASPYLLANDPGAARLATAPLPPGATLLAGSVRAEFARDGRPTRVWNSLVALDAQGAVLDAYDKAHLVPFGEYTPLRGLLPIRLVLSALDFSAGPGLRRISLPGLPSFGGLICYEVIFPGAVTPAERPAFLVNVTNDAWFGVSAGPYQHLAAARLRAVEEGLPLARAAQTGISAVFDARGREVERMGLAETGVVLAPLPRAGSTTPFASLGLWIPFTFLALVGLASGILSRRKTGMAGVAGDTS